MSDFSPIESILVPRFSEPATFMRAPLIGTGVAPEIALLGVPFDLGSTNRAGARHGPAQVREMSRMIRRFHPVTNRSPFDACRIADAGDAPVNPLDAAWSIDAIADRVRALRSAGAIVVAVGGDHTVTLPLIRGCRDAGPVGLVQFDSHADVFDEIYGSRVNHGTIVRRSVEEGEVDPRRSIQIGLRGTRFGADDIDWGRDAGIRQISIDEFEELGRAATLAEIHRVTAGGPVYATFDMDGLDPVHAPGTGAPEPGGLSMRDAQVMIRGLAGLDVVGADVNEVAPPLDPSGHTALNAANILFELICIVAVAVGGRRGSAA